MPQESVLGTCWRLDSATAQRSDLTKKTPWNPIKRVEQASCLYPEVVVTGWKPMLETNAPATRRRFHFRIGPPFSPHRICLTERRRPSKSRSNGTLASALDRVPEQASPSRRHLSRRLRGSETPSPTRWNPGATPSAGSFAMPKGRMQPPSQAQSGFATTQTLPIGKSECCGCCGSANTLMKPRKAISTARKDFFAS